MEAEAAQPRPRPSQTRLAFWILFVGLIAALNYAARFSGASGSSGGVSRQEIYSYSTFAGGAIVYAVWLGIVLLIVLDHFDLLALRPPRGWGRALRLATAVVVAIFAWEGVVTTLPLPQSPGKEQGLTPSHWNSRFALSIALSIAVRQSFRIWGMVLIGPGCPRVRRVPR